MFGHVSKVVVFDIVFAGEHVQDLLKLLRYNRQGLIKVLVLQSYRCVLT